MKPQFNKSWLIISIIIIANILIFVFLSNKLESYVVDTMAAKQGIEDVSSLLNTNVPPQNR